MPKFTALDPAEVVIGRGRSSAEARRKVAEVLTTMDAGMIEVERDERPSTVRRWLQEAARERRVRVHTTWADPQQRVLLWKKLADRD